MASYLNRSSIVAADALMVRVYRLLFKAVVALTLLVTVGLSPLLDWFDRQLYDLLSEYAPMTVNADDAVLINIDAQNIAALGGWPIDRKYHAQAIHNLQKGQAGTAVYNIAFVEIDPVNHASDRRLLQTVENSTGVVLPLIAEQGTELPPLGRFELSGALIGHADLTPDSDQVLRRSFLYAGVSYPRWPSLALAALLSYVPARAHDYVGLRTPYLHVGFHNRWSRDYEVLLHPGIEQYLQRIERYRFDALIRGNLSAEQLRNKAVFVGLSRDTHEASHQIAGGAKLSSTEVQAYLFSSLNQGKILSPTVPIWSISIGIAVFFCMFIAGFSAVSGSLRFCLAVLGSVGIFIPMLLYLFGYWVSYLPMLIGLVVLSVQWSWARYVSAIKKP